MNPYDLHDELNQLLRQLDESVTELRKRGQIFARAEHDYRVQLSKRLTEMRASGEPVTHLADIVRGEPMVAQLRMKRDIAEGLNKSCQEAINVYKLKLRLIEGQIEREWSATR